MSEPLASFNRTDRINHWIVAITILALLAAGWMLYFEFFAEETEHGVRDLHKAIGTLILGFGVWRVGYRLFRGFPQPAAEMGSGQLLMVKLAHYLLLAGIIIMPASGFFKSWYAGRPVDMFGLFSMGSPSNKNEALAEIASSIHFLAGVAITVVIAVHIAGAFKHHFIDRDATLARMLRG
jgi:cytochrome b561